MEFSKCLEQITHVLGKVVILVLSRHKIPRKDPNVKFTSADPQPLPYRASVDSLLSVH